LPITVAQIGQREHCLKLRDARLKADLPRPLVPIVDQYQRHWKQQQCNEARNTLPGPGIHHPTANRVEPVRHRSGPALPTRKSSAIGSCFFTRYFDLFARPPHFGTQPLPVSRADKHQSGGKLRYFIFADEAQPLPVTLVESCITGGAGSSKSQASKAQKAGAA
jgi:hypothetical protein